MEKIVRILEQSALQTKSYTDKKTGEQKVMNAVTLKMADGFDTFLGEITGERAVNCPTYDKSLTSIRCSVLWWCVTGHPRTLGNRCRRLQFMWIRFA